MEGVAVLRHAGAELSQHRCRQGGQLGTDIGNLDCGFKAV